MSTPARPVTEADLSAYLDGELEMARLKEVEAGVVREPAMAAQIDIWRRQNEMVRAAFGRVAAEPIPAALTYGRHDAHRAQAGARIGCTAPLRLAGAMEGDAADQMHRRRQTRIMVATVLSFLAGGAATVALSALIRTSTPLLVPAISISSSGFPDAARRLGLRALETHDTFTTRAPAVLDVSAAHRDDIGKWLRELLRTDVPPPDLSVEGLQLAGGRLTPGEQNPAAWLLYRGRDNERIGLFLTRLAAADADPRYEEDAHDGTVFWTSSGFGFAVTGPRDHDRLAQIAGVVRASLLLTR